jgi:hypothetical protein
MKNKTIERLKYLCNIIPPLLSAIDEQAFSFKPAPNKWSKKEILGHLIDSANNNHQRFVRARFEDVPTIFYQQDNWNKYGYYNLVGSEQVIALWAAYNNYLAELISHIPEEALGRECKTDDGKSHTLEFLINDYVDHLEHHLKQIVNYS